MQIQQRAQQQQKNKQKKNNNYEYATCSTHFREAMVLFCPDSPTLLLCGKVLYMYGF